MQTRLYILLFAGLFGMSAPKIIGVADALSTDAAVQLVAV
jgi:hypothetical protein